MSEKLLVCDALDERDFLRKKITKAIRDAKFVGSKRIKDKKVGVVPVDEFKKSAESDYQSIVDSIKRYNDIDIAITMSNANTTINTRSGKEMTVAAAIALRKSLKGGNSYNGINTDFNGLLLRQMLSQYTEAIDSIDRYNKKADTELEGYKTSLTGRDGNKKLTEDEVKMVETLTSDLYGDLVDPIKIKEKIDALEEDYNNLIKELDTAIKISNATTYVEF